MSRARRGVSSRKLKEFKIVYRRGVISRTQNPACIHSPIFAGSAEHPLRRRRGAET
ncbi:hypothetical protein KCP74_20355 [Salmonella enterica subsp. enterica]|nr:hypothetical protein KCP74_20355 [Salmonella enterica subsp. enterica]